MERYTVNLPKGTKKLLEKRAKQKGCVTMLGLPNVGEYMRCLIIYDLAEVKK